MPSDDNAQPVTQPPDVTPKYGFMRRVAQILTHGITRSIVLTGNIQDLFFAGQYQQIIPFLQAKYGALNGMLLLVWEQNGPLRFTCAEDRKILSQAWNAWRTDSPVSLRKLEELINESTPTATLELLRQLCVLSRLRKPEDGSPYLLKQFIIIIEGADLLLPNANITHLSDAALQRILIMRDWIGDPGFQAGSDYLILLSESRSKLSYEVTSNPYLLEVAVSNPSEEERLHFIRWFNAGKTPCATFEQGEEAFAKQTAGLTIQTLHQFLKRSAYLSETLGVSQWIEAEEEQAKTQLGEGVLEFKQPTHRLSDVCGSTRLKAFIAKVLIPRIRNGGKGAPSGICICGPNGAGKTFIFEAVAAELGIPVVVLRNIRSKWFGDSDMIMERLERFLKAFTQVEVFVDEVDVQFGGVSPDTHETERRIAARFNNIISDPQNKGRIIVMGMTARVNLLPPDMLRAGRLGDMIIPVLDPEEADRDAFIAWMLKEAGIEEPGELLETVREHTLHAYAGLFEQYRQELKSLRNELGRTLTTEEILSVIREILPAAAIGKSREYQTIQAIHYTTRRSLLTDEQYKLREDAPRRLRQLEAEGITGY